MNISILTAKEVLRMCDPVTNLEKRLFDLVSELQNEVSYLEDLPSSDDCDSCESIQKKVTDAIKQIEVGKASDALNILRAIY